MLAIYTPETRWWCLQQGEHGWCGAGDCWLLDCYWCKRQFYYNTLTENITRLEHI